MIINPKKLHAAIYSAIRARETIVELDDDDKLSIYYESDDFYLTAHVRLTDSTSHWEVLDLEVISENRTLPFDFFTVQDIDYLIHLIDTHLQGRIALELQNRKNRQWEVPSQKYGF
jgi:hypothetical protein